MSPLKWKIITILVILLGLSVGYMFYSFTVNVLLPFIFYGEVNPESWWITGVPFKVKFFSILILVIILLTLWMWKIQKGGK